MNISTIDVTLPEVERVKVTEDTLMAELSDGRTISVPLDWYPKTHARDGRRKTQLATYQRRFRHLLARPKRRPQRRRLVCWLPFGSK